MPRPAVIVYQEYAQLNLPTPQSANLNTCVAAVAKQVVDYSSDSPAATRVVAVSQSDVDDGYAAKVGEPVIYKNGAMVLAPVGLKGTSVLEPASVTVKFAAPEVVQGVVRTAVVRHATYANWLVFSGAEAAGLVKGMKLYALNSVAEWVSLGTIQDIDPVDSALPAGAQNVTLDVDVPATVYDAATKALNGVQATYALSGVYNVRSLDVDPDPEEGKVGLAIGAAIVDGETEKEVFRCENVHIEYVARRTDLNFMQDVNSADEVAALLGPVDPRNPLALAAYLALQNTATKVLAYGVTAESVTAFGEFQRAVMPRADVYCIVPVCADAAVQLEVTRSLKARVEDMARPAYVLEHGVPQRFKMVVAGGFPEASDVQTLYTVSSDATVTQVAGSSTLWELVDSAAQFFTLGVAKGDAVTTDASEWFGTSGGTVQKVVSNTTLWISGPASPSTATTYIVRRMDEDAITADLANVPKGVGSKRVVMLAGNSVTVSGLSIPSTVSSEVSVAFLGAAVGGLVAGLPPHQGLTNLSVSGISKIVGTHTHFSDENLSTLSDAGWCIYVQGTPSEAPYCLHGVTTDNTILEFSEIMSVKNFDFVASTLSNSLKQFVGTWNLTNETLGYIRAALSNSIAAVQRDLTVPKLGSPIISGTVDSVGQSSTNADRAEVYVSLQMPRTLNTIGLHLVSA